MISLGLRLPLEPFEDARTRSRNLGAVTGERTFVRRLHSGERPLGQLSQLIIARFEVGVGEIDPIVHA